MVIKWSIAIWGLRQKKFEKQSYLMNEKLAYIPVGDKFDMMISFGVKARWNTSSNGPLTPVGGSFGFHSSSILGSRVAIFCLFYQYWVSLTGHAVKGST